MEDEEEEEEEVKKKVEAMGTRGLDEKGWQERVSETARRYLD